MFKKFKQNIKKFMTEKSGFSLVELIVVIAIMAVMAAVLAPALLGYVEKSRMQKDDSAMSEVVNSMKLSLADQEIYDELLQASVKNNYSCYADGNTDTNSVDNRIILKEPTCWMFNENARLLDETVYFPAGSMRGVTITFKTNGSFIYELNDGIVNQIGNDATKKGNYAGKLLSDVSFEATYNRLRSSIGDTLKISSQTYRNSDYTIFISMGTTGGNEAIMQDAIQVWGQFNGTNLSEVTDNSIISSGSQDVNYVAPPVDVNTVDSTLANNSWDTIRKVARSGQFYEVGWNVGDLSPVFTIGEKSYQAKVIGVNHDGAGTITFHLTSPIGTSRCYNSVDSNSGGWGASDVRSYLNNDIYNNVSNDLKSCIKLSEHLSNNKNYSAKNKDLTYTSDYLFLLSKVEVGKPTCSHNGNSYLDEGTSYEYFTSDSSRIIQGASNWWLRSLLSGVQDAQHQINSVGKCAAFDVDNTASIVPAFVVG